MNQSTKPPVWPPAQRFTAEDFIGFAIPYTEGMAIMRRAMAEVDTLGPKLLLLEHEDTITITRQHGRKHLLVEEDELKRQGIFLFETDRGGDVTFHGKGQLVGYPILRLPSLKTPLAGAFDVDLMAYVRTLENCLLEFVQELGVSDAYLIHGQTGIWVPSKHERAAKLVAIGVGVSKGVTRHGFALNVSTDIERFTKCIVPCGLHGYGASSLERELRLRNLALPSFSTLCAILANKLWDHLLNNNLIKTGDKEASC
jgi:lipoyl(octanoyl) transferase